MPIDSLDKLKSAFTTVLGLDASTDFESLRYGDGAGWDSVAHLALITHIENEFDLMLPTEDVIDMSSFTKAKEILAKHGITVDA
jgi:acyl carrier protein